GVGEGEEGVEHAARAQIWKDFARQPADQIDARAAEELVGSVIQLDDAKIHDAAAGVAHRLEQEERIEAGRNGAAESAFEKIEARRIAASVGKAHESSDGVGGLLATESPRRLTARILGVGRAVTMALLIDLDFRAKIRDD